MWNVDLPGGSFDAKPSVSASVWEERERGKGMDSL
jgi:hypothetical protein